MAPGGMRMSGYDDGYNATPAELARAEREHSDPDDDLHALQEGRKHLLLAKAWLRDGGYVIPRIDDDLASISEAIRLLKEG